MATIPIDDIPLGAHLTTPRAGYIHHGIYAGHGRVIHYRGFNRLFRKGPVEEISFERFARGRSVSMQSWPVTKFVGHARIARARSRIGEDRYRFWTNNCEHFCEWCITGVHRSAQVEVWRTRLDRLREAFGSLVSIAGLQLTRVAQAR
jgi:HRAS-like suppressor 3